MTIETLGIDIAKNVFQLHGVNLTRTAAILTNIVTVVMEKILVLRLSSAQFLSHGKQRP